MLIGNGYNDGCNLFNVRENYICRVKFFIYIFLNYLGGNSYFLFV